MVCSYFDDRLAEILSHNHSADLNTIESCQMESSRGQVFQKKKHQCTSYGSFQSPLPTPWHKDAHSPLESRWENTHTKIPGYSKTVSSFWHTQAEQVYPGKSRKTPSREILPPLYYFAWVCNCAAACCSPNSAYGPSVTTVYCSYYSYYNVTLCYYSLLKMSKLAMYYANSILCFVPGWDSPLRNLNGMVSS